MPYCPIDGSKAFFYNQSSDMKLVANYTGLDFMGVMELDVFGFWGYLHDSVVWECGRTPDGREYLESAYYYMQTEPDRAALRDKFGGGGKSGK